MEEKHYKIEREKARQLRKSRWWQNTIAAGTSCYYCEEKIAGSAVTMDHVVPLSRGGRSTRGNLVACCKRCNNEKKYLTAAEWVSYQAQLRSET